MKINIAPFIVGLLLTSVVAYSQVVDHAQLEVLYHFEAVFNRSEPERRTTDETILLIGDRYTAYFSFMNFIRDSLRRANPAEYGAQIMTSDGRILTRRPGETAEELTARGGAGTTIVPARTRLPLNPFGTGHSFINRRTNEVVVSQRIVNMQTTRLDDLRYTETLENPAWTIRTETQNIIGYHTQKATARFGGRDWTVWFTPDIPVSEGPWKLRGLPGLILKAETADGEFSLTATSVVRGTSRPIVKNEERIYRNVPKRDFFRLKTNGLRNPHRPIEFNHIYILE